jgi:hypothetical protein
MNLRRGDMFLNSPPEEWIGFTANGMLNNKGELVMGAGNALQMKQRFPDMPLKIGNKLRGLGEATGARPPYTFNVMALPTYKVIVFQSKLDWKDQSPTQLVIQSLQKLNDAMQTRPTMKLNMPVPGIGHGGMDFEAVKLLIEKHCPAENITWWVKE